MSTRRRKVIGLAASRVIEEYAYMLDLLRVPRLQRKQEKIVLQCYQASNRIRRQIGVEPKVFKRLKNRDIVEVIVT